LVVMILELVLASLAKRLHGEPPITRNKHTDEYYETEKLQLQASMNYAL